MSCATPSSACRPYDPAMSRAAGAAALGVALIVAGTAFDTVSLYVPGVALLVLAAGAAAWVALAAFGAGVRRLPGPPTVEEDQPYPIEMEIRHGVLPPPGGTLSDPLLDEPVAVGPGSARRTRIQVRFPRRGRRTLEPAQLEIADPLRLAVRRTEGEEDRGELLVLPRVEPVLAPGGGGSAAAGATPGGAGGRQSLRGRMDGSAAELDLDGLRPYRQGTPASRIHWPAFARGGEMVERRLTAESDSAPLVVLDTTKPPSGEALDMAVRAAASLCVHLAHGGGCALLLPGDRRPSPLGPDLAAWQALHARLALAEAVATRPPLARAKRAGAVIWVSARPDAPRDLTRAAGGGAFHVAPGAPEAGDAFSVAGCAGSRLGRTVLARAGRAA